MFAVRTTTLRALEATFLDSRTEFKGSTDLFIYPGFKFKVVDYLLTNFHQPKSTLMMMVAAFTKKDFVSCDIGYLEFNSSQTFTAFSCGANAKHECEKSSSCFFVGF